MTITRENQLKQDTERFYDCTVEAAAELMDLINTDTQPDGASEEAVFFPDGYFDVIEWVNCECLEANSHELLLATGGPAYGVSLVHGAPVFWYQDWFTSKQCIQLEGLAFDFYVMIFEYLEELDY